MNHQNSDAFPSDCAHNPSVEYKNSTNISIEIYGSDRSLSNVKDLMGELEKSGVCADVLLHLYHSGSDFAQLTEFFQDLGQYDGGCNIMIDVIADMQMYDF